MFIRSNRPGLPPRHQRAFTLLELMVVVGIIALLMALLIPLMRQTVEASRRVTCLANIRTLTTAILSYVSANDGILPDACSTNSFESQLAPSPQGLAAGTRVGQFYVLPTIGALLQPYLADSGAGVWTCPSAANQPAVLSGDDPFSGYAPVFPPNQFHPQYDYLSAKELIQFATAARPNGDQTKLRTWATRNISGLRASNLAPLGKNTNVVLIHDRDSSYHSRFKNSIYTSPDDTDYFQNFGYLDGHAEGRAFRNVSGYMACLHGPIRQSWCGVDFVATFPEQYAGY